MHSKSVLPCLVQFQKFKERKCRMQKSHLSSNYKIPQITGPLDSNKYQKFPFNLPYLTLQSIFCLFKNTKSKEKILTGSKCNPFIKK